MWWENGFIQVKDNRLHLGSQPASAIAEKFGTPLFVYSRNQMAANYENLLTIFKKHLPRPVRIYYAMKANPHPGILKLFKHKNAGIDAVSPGEIEAALEAGYPQEEIIFTGTSLSRKDMNRVLAFPDIIFNLDAMEQLEMLKEVRDAASPGHTVKISLRWNPGKGRGFNPKVVTAGIRTPEGIPVKFGVEDRQVLPFFHKAASFGFIPMGLHQHLGSGWVGGDFDAVAWAADKMIEKAAELHMEGFRLDFLDFGGGFGPKYFAGQTLFPLEKYAAKIGTALRNSSLPVPEIIFEPGKYLTADAGVLLMRVEYVKRCYGNTFACVNAGTFNTVPRPAIYTGAEHPVVNCAQVSCTEPPNITVAGNLCETGDLFAREIPMPEPKSGDILAMLAAGAYCRSMASRFNLRDIPQEVLI
jgi:diaminopimelate decarboxylase